MSVWCECENCQGTEPAAFCENAILAAYIKAHTPIQKKIKKNFFLKIFEFLKFSKKEDKKT
jgi:hypothetical protein